MLFILFTICQQLQHPNKSCFSSITQATCNMIHSYSIHMNIFQHWNSGRTLWMSISSQHITSSSRPQPQLVEFKQYYSYLLIREIWMMTLAWRIYSKIMVLIWKMKPGKSSTIIILSMISLITYGKMGILTLAILTRQIISQSKHQCIWALWIPIKSKSLMFYNQVILPVSLFGRYPYYWIQQL